jgi:hypothetical protein
VNRFGPKLSDGRPRFEILRWYRDGKIGTIEMLGEKAWSAEKRVLIGINILKLREKRLLR